MSALDLEQGNHRHSVGERSEGSSFSDAENGSCQSQFYSTNGGSYDDYSFACVSDAEIAESVVEDSRRVSSVSECSVVIDVVESKVPEVKVHFSKVEDCRICHLGLESHSHESGSPIELGCSCKDDLAAAHRQCAEAWFKIKGNKTCEICNSVARNVMGTSEMEIVELSNETNNAAAISAASESGPHLETRRFWQGHRFLNFLLACMVFAFVISWLLHFNVPSS